MEGAMARFGRYYITVSIKDAARKPWRFLLKLRDTGPPEPRLQAARELQFALAVSNSVFISAGMAVNSGLPPGLAGFKNHCSYQRCAAPLRIDSLIEAFTSVPMAASPLR